MAGIPTPTLRDAFWRLVFDAGAPIYDRLTAQGIWEEEIRGFLRFLPPLRPGLRLLDLGCGPGLSAFVLGEELGPEVEIVGIDLSSKMIARARANHRRHYPQLTQIRFELADAIRLAFADGHFDIAVGHSFLYLVADRAAVLAEIRRLLTPGGLLLLMEPAREGSLLEATRRGLPAWRTHATGSSLRFAASMVVWRAVSAVKGRLSDAEIQRLFAAAGFVRAYTEPTLGGLGLFCVGEVGVAAAGVPAASP